GAVGPYLTVFEDWSEAEIAAGNAAAVVDRVVEMAQRHPFRERLRITQMLALHNSGRQPEALSVFDDLRRALAAEFGLEPSPALVRCYQSILNSPQETPREQSAVAEPATVRNRIPRDVPQFTGRETYARQLLDV